ncbi:MAG: GspE/PulE family protein [Desulfonatronovibrionaceae bacterium]
MNDFQLDSVPRQAFQLYLAFPQRNDFLPVHMQDGLLTVLLRHPDARSKADYLGWKLGLQVNILSTDQEQFYSFLEQALSLWEDDRESDSHQKENAHQDHDLGKDLLGWSHQDAPIVRLVNKAMHMAISRGASDIHFESRDQEFLIRYRIDGRLQTVRSLDQGIKSSVLARIKVMAHMDVSETRTPQDGRFQVRVGNRNIDLRVSTMPTLNGEKAVLRILDRTRNILPLSRLGIKDQDISLLRESISSPYGIILVTGPTGSGKTTTLYAALSELLDESLNIMTVEDPVEYHLSGVNQVQVNRAAGVTFAGAVRSFLRQDPDIILIGEIRDKETVSAAVQASLTGHLVLATLHTNDAPTAVARLLEMGVEPFLLASSLIMVLAQRLVRLNCPHCAAREEVSPATLSLLRDRAADFTRQTRSTGCDQCLGTGSQGRQGIYEFMPATESLRALMVQKASADRIREHARSLGLSTMLEHGLDLVRSGNTTIEEVLRVTRF